MSSEMECETKKWGSSVGVIIPKQIIEKESINVGEKVIIEIKKRRTAKEFFGTLTNWKKSTDEIKKEFKKGWK